MVKKSSILFMSIFLSILFFFSFKIFANHKPLGQMGIVKFAIEKNMIGTQENLAPDEDDSAATIPGMNDEDDSMNEDFSTP